MWRQEVPPKRRYA